MANGEPAGYWDDLQQDGKMHAAVSQGLTLERRSILSCM